jgi:hypothetical protein
MINCLLWMAFYNPHDSNMPNMTTFTTTLTAPAVTYNDITSPFNKLWDLSQKADQERWLIASQAASDHVRFDVSVATAKIFMELLKDKSKYYCWNLLLLMLLHGNGTYDGMSNTLANGMKVDLRNCINLFTQWSKVSTACCKQFAQWCNGKDVTRLDHKFEDNPTQRKVIALDCNANNNYGLVC